MKIGNSQLGALGFRFKDAAAQEEEVATNVAALKQQVAQLTQALQVERAKRARLAQIIKPMLDKARTTPRGGTPTQGRAYRSDGKEQSAQQKALVPEVLPPESEVEEAPAEASGDSFTDTVHAIMGQDDDLEEILGG